MTFPGTIIGTIIGTIASTTHPSEGRMGLRDPRRCAATRDVGGRFPGGCLPASHGHFAAVRSKNRPAMLGLALVFGALMYFEAISFARADSCSYMRKVTKPRNFMAKLSRKISIATKKLCSSSGIID